MPIIVPDGLPAKSILDSERTFALEENVAQRQDIRPLRVLLLNLMPKKIETETQILRLISKSPLQVELDFMCMSTHESRNTPHDHLVKFYDTFENLRGRSYDGMIVTGAPIEHLPFEAVDYWDELRAVFDWARSHVYSTLTPAMPPSTSPSSPRTSARTCMCSATARSRGRASWRVLTCATSS